MRVALAEFQFDGSGTAEEVADRQCLGHSHRSVQLDRVLRNIPQRSIGDDLRRRYRPRAVASVLGGILIARKRGEKSSGVSLLGLHKHVDEAMLECLETGQR